MEIKLKKIGLLFISLSLSLLTFASEELDTNRDEMNQIIDNKKNDEIGTHSDLNLQEKMDEIQKEANQVLQISQANISKEKEKFIAQEIANKKLRYAIMTGLWAAGSGVLFWFIFGGDSKQEFTKEQHKEIIKFVNERLKERDKEKEDNAWYKNLYLDIKSNLFGLPKYLITSLIFAKAFELINQSIDKFFEIKNKVFAKRNIAWFIYQKTQFEKIIQDISNLIENFNAKDQSMTNDELISVLSLLTIQLERILGFIEYRTDEFAQIKNTYVLMGQTIKNTIIDKTNQYFDSVNLVLKEDKDKTLVLNELKGLLLFIVSKIKMFATVESSAGFSDNSSSKILDNLHNILTASSDKVDQDALDKIRSLLLGGDLPNFDENDEIS